MSGDAAGVLQAFYAKLRADGTLAAMLAEDGFEGSPTSPAIYSSVPQVPKSEDASKFPYVVLGDDNAAPFDTDDVAGEETIADIHIWDAGESPLRAIQVRDRIKAVLHDTTLDVAGTHFLFCYFYGSQSVPDPDPLLQHKVISFRIVTMSS